MTEVNVTKRLEADKRQLTFSENKKVEGTFFQWYDEAREKFQWRTWVVALIEFIGTFLVTVIIISPSAFGLYDAETYGGSEFGQAIELIFSFMFMRALWVAAGIWVLITLFHRISVNINPAVTIAEMAAHNHLRAQGVVKIFAQLTGAIVASYITLYLGLAWMGEVESLDSIDLGIHNYYVADPNSSLGFTIGTTDINLADHQLYLAAQFLMEFVLTFLLLLTIFSTDHIKWSVRSWIIALALVVLISIGTRTNTVALNPARLIGPAMASATYNLNHGTSIDATALTSLPLILLAELSASLLMFFIQGTVKTKSENLATIKESEMIKLSWAKILALEILIDETTVDKKTFYEMNTNELHKKAKELGIDKIDDMSTESLIDKISFVLIEKYLNEKLIKEQKRNVIIKKQEAKKVVLELKTNSKESKNKKNISLKQKNLEQRIQVIRKTIINTNKN